MRERDINELILQIFEEQEESFYFPLYSQKDAKAFVKALNTKGLGYEKLCDDIGESEHSFNTWRKSLSRPGVGQRVIERINQPFVDLLEEDADQLMLGTTANSAYKSPTANHNGCQNGVSPSPVRSKQSPSAHKDENESELAERLNRARNRLQESSKKEKKQEDEKEDGSEEESSSSSSGSQNSVNSKKDERTDDTKPRTHLENVRASLRRSNNNLDGKFKEKERGSSLRDRETNGDVAECRKSVQGLMAKFENFADTKRQSNNVSPTGSDTKSNSEEDMSEVSTRSERSEVSSRSERSEARQRSPSPPWKSKSPLSSPRSFRSSQSPELEMSPRREIESVELRDESESESTERQRESESTERQRESEGTERSESESAESECTERRKESESTDKRRESESTEKRKESVSTERGRESESTERRKESESTERRESEKQQHRNESEADCDSFVTANGSQREDDNCSFEEVTENGVLTEQETQIDDSTFIETSTLVPQSPLRESLKDKEERLAEEVKAEVTSLRSKIKEQFEAARKNKAAKNENSVNKGDADVDENYNSDLDPDNEDQSPIMSTLVQRISNSRGATKNGPGYLYVFSDTYDDQNSRVKIGTTRFPDKRLRQAQVFNPDMWQILAQPVNQRIAALEDLAASLTEYAEPKTKYWFRCNFDKVIEAAEKTVSKYASKTLPVNDDSTC